MTAVQRPLRAIDGDLYVLIAAHAKHNLLATGLMHWAITNDPGIAFQELLVQIDDLAEVRRTGFFFAFKNKLEVD